MSGSFTNSLWAPFLWDRLASQDTVFFSHTLQECMRFRTTFTLRALGSLWFLISSWKAWCILPQTLSRSRIMLSHVCVFCLPNEIVSSVVIFRLLFRSPDVFLDTEQGYLEFLPVSNDLFMDLFLWHISPDIVLKTQRKKEWSEAK